jgi:uncharacterized protein (TIGR02646 family)
MLDYNLKGKISALSSLELNVITVHPPIIKEDWNKSQYEPIKQRIKRELYFGQLDRCAYCRKTIEADAKYEPLEHIVAKSIKPQWMLNPKNLIVTCDSCNNLKGDEQTLVDTFQNTTDLPEDSSAYIIFNPHFDDWQEHLAYENELFIVPVVNSKGSETIRICKLDRYNTIINRAKEIKIGQKEPTIRILYRLQNIDSNNPNAENMRQILYQAMNHFINRVVDNQNFN